MLFKYILIFLISMVPMVELRLAIPIAVSWELDYWTAMVVCVLGNMLPVPFVYFFARKVLHWGADKKYTHKFFTFCLEKGEKAGRQLMEKTGRGGLGVALMLFVGIPIPGTGAWTGALAASFLKMGIRDTALYVSLGVILAGIIMGIGSHTALHVFGF